MLFCHSYVACGKTGRFVVSCCSSNQCGPGSNIDQSSLCQSCLVSVSALVLMQIWAFLFGEEWVMICILAVSRMQKQALHTWRICVDVSCKNADAHCARTAVHATNALNTDCTCLDHCAAFTKPSALLPVPYTLRLMPHALSHMSYATFPYAPLP